MIASTPRCSGSRASATVVALDVERRARQRAPQAILFCDPQTLVFDVAEIVDNGLDDPPALSPVAIASCSLTATVASPISA